MNTNAAVLYYVYNKDEKNAEHYRLGSTTHRSARIRAKNFARDVGWKNYGIVFTRTSDGCHGEIDKVCIL